MSKNKKKLILIGTLLLNFGILCLFKYANFAIEQINSLELVKEYMKNGDTKKDAIKKVAKLKGVNKDVVYKECLDI